MEHTGFGWNNETVECSSGVQHFTQRNKKWTHWGVPACIDGAVPEPVRPDPQPDPAPAPAGKPTIRRGSKGEFVTLAQTLLINRGYQLPRFGADGDFGGETEKAVRQFQRDWGLTEDGVIGPKTWAMLESTPAKMKTYRVVIGGLDLAAARALADDYPGATMSEE